MSNSDQPKDGDGYPLMSHLSDDRDYIDQFVLRDLLIEVEDADHDDVRPEEEMFHFEVDVMVPQTVEFSISGTEMQSADAFRESIREETGVDLDLAYDWNTYRESFELAECTEAELVPEGEL